ncbi:hypothetical protein Vqi01_46800 [Micromonospora qiuiae]|uniref:FAD-binding domain-containing protein n=1 Tax=Micromonospora qiuiae TaxID=502268 RepID=A0ABQ4JG90_9ACTN|nr:FAD-dependent monooxygenase [Micromonospora qiuiae]GIJ29518.1 hypothetical protein Vqi01_46800 [Micromonospora qiuiae]
MTITGSTSLPDSTDVLVAGGGPAGAFLACLLARRGFRVLLVEKQATLERTFRGDTVLGPSVVILKQLGFGPALEEHGYIPTERLVIQMEGRKVLDLDYRRFKCGETPIDIPQPALLDIVYRSSAQEPGFQVVFGTTVTELLEENGVVKGAVLRGKGGEKVPVRARLVIGADGRFSRVRKAAGFEAKVTPMDRDVLWFRVPRPEGWAHRTDFFVERDRHVVVMPTFPDGLRIATNLPKKALGAWRQAGLPSVKQIVAQLDPRLGPLMDKHVRSWDDTSFLEIFTAEVDQWARDGLLLIGDASHTVTPILGQGINLALQDAVTLAPVLDTALRRSSGDGTVPAATFADWIAKRRKHKAFVTRFQTRNEASMVATTRLGTWLRRNRYLTMNMTPAKYVLAPKMMSEPFPIDPADVRQVVPV